VTYPRGVGTPGRRLWSSLAIGGGLVALVGAASKAWLCDDAFISFRYALNLARGHGLVFNAGERVEGYTNFLWTVWCAAPIAAGLDVETWAIAWGLAAWCGTLVLLARHGDAASGVLPRSDLATRVPVPLLLAAVHPDLAVFATSGLETSLFTFLVLAGFVACARSRASSAGLLWGLATLTRPDGAVFVLVGVAWTLVTRRERRWRAATALAAGAAIVVVPHLAWRVWYYHDLVPNTYHAKSAALAWWSQGSLYVGLYACRDWAVIAAALAGLASALAGPCRGENGRARIRAALESPLVLAALLAGTYALSVARVGGDFMFARLLIPVIPFLLLLASAGLSTIPGRSLALGAFAVVLAATALTPRPVPAAVNPTGIDDEWTYYNVVRGTWARDSRIAGETLKRYGEGLNLAIAFSGAQARMVYYSEVPLAVESVTGLTDRYVANQPLLRRGRVGHEKHAPPEYLLERGVHLYLDGGERDSLGDALDRVVPRVGIVLGALPCRLIRWDPAVVETLVRRGATVPDFPATLDRYLATIDARPLAELRRDHALARSFYFRWRPDPAREAPFLRRLGIEPEAAATP